MSTTFWTSDTVQLLSNYLEPNKLIALGSTCKTLKHLVERLQFYWYLRIMSRCHMPCTTCRLHTKEYLVGVFLDTNERLLIPSIDCLPPHFKQSLSHDEKKILCSDLDQLMRKRRLRIEAGYDLDLVQQGWMKFGLFLKSKLPYSCQDKNHFVEMTKPCVCLPPFDHKRNYFAEFMLFGCIKSKNVCFPDAELLLGAIWKGDFTSCTAAIEKQLMRNEMDAKKLQIANRILNKFLTSNFYTLFPLFNGGTKIDQQNVIVKKSRKLYCS